MHYYESIQDRQVDSDELYHHLMESQQIMVYDFYDSISQIRVVKNKGKENESLQDEVKEQKETQSFWSSLKEKMEGSKEEVINIFSVASGHLYERFLRIMMYSVTKNTSKSVKFWIIENFLSPSFKVCYNSKQPICSEFFLTMPSILDLTMTL